MGGRRPTGLALMGEMHAWRARSHEACVDDRSNGHSWWSVGHLSRPLRQAGGPSGGTTIEASFTWRIVRIARGNGGCVPLFRAALGSEVECLSIFSALRADRPIVFLAMCVRCRKK